MCVYLFTPFRPEIWKDMSTTHSKSTGKLITFKHIYFVLYNNLIAQFNKEHDMKLVCIWNPFASTSLDRRVCLRSPMEMLRGFSSMQVPCFLLNSFNILQGCIFKFLSGSEPSRANGLKQPCGGGEPFWEGLLSHLVPTIQPSCDLLSQETGLTIHLVI